MMMLTKEIKKKLPPLRSTENTRGTAIVPLKFFDPLGSWTWYAWEAEEQVNIETGEADWLFFGLVDGFEKELGYFSLAELMSIRAPWGGPRIERDLHWKSISLAELLRNVGMADLANEIEGR